MKKQLFKLFALFGFSVLLLTSCGAKQESSEQVIQKFKDNLTQINSADMGITVDVNGTQASDKIDASARLDVKFDRQEEEDHKMEMGVSLSGNMKTEDQTFSGDLGFDLISLNDDFYVKLLTFDTTDENLKALEPLIALYKGNWLHLASELIPENIRNIQKKDPETLLKEKALKQLFVETRIVNITKEYGVETVNGNKVYHFGFEFDKEGVSNYIRQAAVIDGREMTEAEVEENAQIVHYINDAQMWVGMKDYYPYKTSFTITPPEDAEVSMNIGLLFEANSFNEAVPISAPADFTEFNPLELLMGANSMGGGAEMPTDMPEFELDEMEVIDGLPADGQEE